MSWSAFCAANVLIDLESLYYLQRGEYPVHRQLHTFVGAGLAGLVTIALLLLARLPLGRWLARFGAEAKPAAIVAGALAGASSHPLLDGVMHPDIEPFGPWTTANPLFQQIGLGALHVGCALAGIGGMVLLYLRQPRGRAPGET